MMRIDVNQQESLTDEQIGLLQEMRRRCSKRILLATTLAKSGHPGGSLSSLDTLLVLYSIMNHRPGEPDWSGRDRLIVSIGHISPGVYSTLSEFGYFPEEDFLEEFRRAGSAWAGHVERVVPGVEWNTGNLGQGLSAGVGFALAAERLGRENKTIVLMGDGEQQKGQVAEARRFSAKYGLSNLIGIIDRNHLQIGGDTEEVMPVRVRDEYAAAGWNVIYVPNGHDYQAIFKALRRAWLHQDLEPSMPTVLVVRTVMGKGVSFMENKAKYHGSPLPEDDCRKALEEIGSSGSELDAWRARREKRVSPKPVKVPGLNVPSIDQGTPILYGTDVKTDCRSAYGAALKDLAEKNNPAHEGPKIIGFSCDLEGSVKMQGFHGVSPNAFFESGIQEHHAAACAGAASLEGVVPFFSTFGVFAVAETYNQHRLSDQNHTNIKIVSTHLGLDVGEDGPTHQSIDYLGLLTNLFGFSIFMPADPNQTDRIVRYAASHEGNVFVGMGRSKMNVVTDEDGAPYFGTDYKFEPGKADLLRNGTKATIITYGSLVPYVMEAHELLKQEGLDVAVLNMASLKPIDEEAILEAAGRGPILTAEDHVVFTGLGSMVSRVLVSRGVTQKVLCLGVSHYGSSGKPADLYKMQGLDSQSIAGSMKELLA